MSEHDKSDQARKGLVDSVKGKAKEVVGAVIGNDSLTAEGQLEQTQAQERKAANSVEAVADAEAEQARADATAAQLESLHERNAVNAQAAAATSSIEAQRNSQAHAVEHAAARDVIHAETHAEIEAQQKIQLAKADESQNQDAAADELAEAADEHDTADRITTRAHDEADRIRARAEQLASDAGLK